MLSHDDRKVGASLRQVRLYILKVAGIALLATILLSLYLGGTITQPVRRLAAAGPVDADPHQRDADDQDDGAGDDRRKQRQQAADEGRDQEAEDARTEQATREMYKEQSRDDALRG